MNDRIKVIGCCLTVLILTITIFSVNATELLYQKDMIHENLTSNMLAPDLVYSPTYHDFGNVSAGNTYSTTFDIWNGGTDTLIWSLGIVDPWLIPSPMSGNSTGETDTVTVQINTTGLSPGSYTGKVGISANDGGGVRFFTVYFHVAFPTNNPPNTPDQLVGPTLVEEGVQYTYYSSATDPDGDQIKLGLDFNNDGIINFNHWTEFIPSGATYYFHITFIGTGTRYIRVKAEDVHGAQSNFSTPLVVVVIGSNDPPEKPSLPIGPSTGEIHVAYTFLTNTTDPDNDQIRYGWDWDGDDTIDEWSTMVESGNMDTRTHVWSTPGTYYVKVLAEDEHEGQSEFSNPKIIVITSNNQPSKPTISGTNTGKIGKSYSYTGIGNDPDGDNIYYWFDWGDGSNTGWTGPYESGQPASEAHIWDTQGTFNVKVKIKDTEGAVSVWSDAIPISMPKSKQYIHPFLWFLDQHPNLFPLLHQLLQLR